MMRLEVVRATIESMGTLETMSSTALPGTTHSMVTGLISLHRPETIRSVVAMATTRCSVTNSTAAVLETTSSMAAMEMTTSLVSVEQIFSKVGWARIMQLTT